MSPNLRKNKQVVMISLICSFLFSCITGEQITNLRPGMTENEVSKIMGNPDGFKVREGFTVFTYNNRLISGWSSDRADYHVILRDNKLVEYGAGEVRERNVGGVQSLFIWNMN